MKSVQKICTANQQNIQYNAIYHPVDAAGAHVHCEEEIVGVHMLRIVHVGSFYGIEGTLSTPELLGKMWSDKHGAHP